MDVLIQLALTPYPASGDAVRVLEIFNQVLSIVNSELVPQAQEAVRFK